MEKIDFILQPGETVSFDVDEVLFVKDSPFQKIEIVRTKTFGKSIFLDRKPQSSEVDHFIFNEILVHPAMIFQDDPKSVLMIGGGPGSGLAELVKYKSLDKIVICDLDREAVGAYQRLLPEWHRGAYSDQRVQLHHVDARHYLEESSHLFDAIYIDIPDPLEGGAAGSLFSVEFYRLIKSRLTPNGIVVSQAGRSSLNNLRYHAGIAATFKEVFKNVSSFDRHIPFYGEPWGFIFASDQHSPFDLSPAEIDRRLASRNISDCLCYTGPIHHSMFTQPPYFVTALKRLARIYTDQTPLRVK